MCTKDHFILWSNKCTFLPVSLVNSKAVYLPMVPFKVEGNGTGRVSAPVKVALCAYCMHARTYPSFFEKALSLNKPHSSGSTLFTSNKFTSLLTATAGFAISSGTNSIMVQPIYLDFVKSNGMTCNQPANLVNHPFVCQFSGSVDWIWLFVDQNQFTGPVSMNLLHKLQILVA